MPQTPSLAACAVAEDYSLGWVAEVRETPQGPALGATEMVRMRRVKPGPGPEHRVVIVKDGKVTGVSG